MKIFPKLWYRQPLCEKLFTGKHPIGQFSRFPFKENLKKAVLRLKKKIKKKEESLSNHAKLPKKSLQQDIKISCLILTSSAISGTALGIGIHFLNLVLDDKSSRITAWQLQAEKNAVSEPSLALIPMKRHELITPCHFIMLDGETMWVSPY